MNAQPQAFDPFPVYRDKGKAYRMTEEQVAQILPLYARRENKACKLKNGAHNSMDQYANGIRANFDTNRARQARLDAMVDMAREGPVTIQEAADHLKVTMETVEDYFRQLRAMGRISAERYGPKAKEWHFVAVEGVKP